MQAAAFGYIQQMVKQQAGIVVEPGKEYLAESRLSGFAKEQGFATLDNFVDTLRLSPYSETHRRVIELLTTNETSFFRDFRPFEALRQTIIPQLVAARPGRNLTIWCAASSSGQEPYSLAMLIREHFPALVPTTLRAEQTVGQVGNEVGLLLMKLPVGEPDALGRLLRVATLTKAAKATQHPEYISTLLGIGSAFGLARPFLALQRMINIFVTDVPGPPVPLYFLGAKIEEVLPIIGPGGNVSLMVSAFSYCGRLSLLLDVRASAYPDIDVLVGGMQRSWEALSERSSSKPVAAHPQPKRGRSKVS